MLNFSKSLHVVTGKALFVATPEGSSPRRFDIAPVSAFFPIVEVYGNAEIIEENETKSCHLHFENEEVTHLTKV